MRRALNPTPATQDFSDPVPIPAPVGGWNTRDGLGNMPITDAINLDNWYPEATDVGPRAGSQTYAQGISDQVETIFSYASGSNLKLFIAAGNILQNISTIGVQGTVAAATVMAGTTAFQNSRFQYVNTGTPGGNFLVAVNGADQRQIYNGTIWFAGSTYSASTIQPFSNVELFNQRIFYLEKNTLRVIYHHQVNAIGGTVGVAMDLSSQFRNGGKNLCIGTWTRDGGAGMDDFLVVASDQGELAVYHGTDPSSSSTWAKVGIYRIAPPLSERCMEKMGGELVIATRAGISTMSSILAGLVQQTPYTDKIRTSVNDAVSLYGDHWGWQLKYVPLFNWLLLNVPVAEGNFQQQFVMNSQTMAWCRYLGLYANVWEIHNKLLFFGGDGVVVEQNTSFLDDDGDNIFVDGRQAASNFGTARQKYFNMFRPLINADGEMGLTADINVDFANVIPTNVPDITPQQVAEWDVATWDDYYWADEATPQLFWQSCGRLGTYGSVRMRGTINSITARWYGTAVVFQSGGVL